MLHYTANVNIIQMIKCKVRTAAAVKYIILLYNNTIYDIRNIIVDYFLVLSIQDAMKQILFIFILLIE